MTNQDRLGSFDEYKAYYQIVQSFVHLENLISKIISHFFTEGKKRGLFEKEILGNYKFSQKVSLFKNVNTTVEALSKSEVDSLDTLAKIRNGIVHREMDYLNKKFRLNLDGKDKDYSIIQLVKLYSSIYVGTEKKLEKKKEEMENAEELKKIIEDIAMVEVHVRNYKWRFVDIYDLVLEDSDGNQISIDYPELNFPVEGYERYVEESMIDFLKDKYKLSKEKYDIDVISDWIEPDSDSD